MYCKIIETILNTANFPFKKIKIKLGLYKRVTVTVKCEPSTGADWKQNCETIAYSFSLYMYVCNVMYVCKHVCTYVYTPFEEKEQSLWFGECYLIMNKRLRKICKILKYALHLWPKENSIRSDKNDFLWGWRFYL